MEIKTTTAALGLCELVLDMSAELPIEGDFTIPDYQPEIWKIVRTKAEPVILGRLAVGNKATVEGYVRLTVFYSSEEGKDLSATVQRIPFSKQFDLKNSASDNCVVSAGAAVSYLNCRAVNERRLDVRGALSVSLAVPSFTSLEAKSMASGDGVWKKTEAVGWTALSAVASKQFTVDERLSVEGGDASASTVLRSEASAVIDGVECTEGRAEIRGTVNVLAALETGADNGFTVKRIGYKIPFIQLVENEAIKQERKVAARAAVVSSAVGNEINSEGMLEASIGCELEVFVLDSGATEMLSDVFSTRCETELVRETLSVAETVESYKERLSVNESFECPDGRIADWFVSNPSVSLVRRDDGFEARVSALACFIAVDDEGNAFGYDKTFELTAPVYTDSPVALLLCPECVFTHTECLEASGRLSFKAECELSGVLAGIRTISSVREIRADEEKPKKRPDAAITAYFAEAGEKVWDIARAFNTSPDGIFEENAPLSETLEEPRVLLLPIVE